MSRLEKLISKKLEEIKELRKRRDEQKKAKKAKTKIIRKGRPKISESILQKIELEAYEKPLGDVALKYDVGLRTLYNYGISRQSIERKKMLKSESLTLNLDK